MKPFFQGKLDVFCAIYAVLNGLKLTHYLRTLEARDIFHETLLNIAPNQAAFRAVLHETTDYLPLVDGMLRIQEQKRALVVHKPFTPSATQPAPPAEVWDCCKTWLNGGDNRAVVFRFLRHLSHETPPVNRHWTTARCIADDKLELFDCSHEETAIQHIPCNGFVTRPDEVDAKRLLCVEPHTVRLLGPRLKSGA